MINNIVLYVFCQNIENAAVTGHGVNSNRFLLAKAAFKGFNCNEEVVML